MARPVTAILPALLVAGLLASNGCRRPESSRGASPEETAAGRGHGQRTPTADERVLLSLLRQASPGQAQEQAARRIIAGALDVRLRYERPMPIADRADRNAAIEFAHSFQDVGAYVTPISHHATDGKTYPHMELSFNRKHSRANPERWLLHMVRPAATGYVLKSVQIVYNPSTETRKATYEACITAFREITEELIGLKARYPQLKAFSMESLYEGRLDASWQTCPEIRYRYGLGPSAEKARNVLHERWCEIVVRFDTAAGPRYATVSGARSYPRQGGSLVWYVRHGQSGQGVAEAVSRTIARALAPFDKLEANLEAEARQAAAKE